MGLYLYSHYHAFRNTSCDVGPFLINSTSEYLDVQVGNSYFYNVQFSRVLSMIDKFELEKSNTLI